MRRAQTRYPEYGNLFRDKRLWTGKREVTQCVRYPVAKLSDGLYATATNGVPNEELVKLFKAKLWQLKAELETLPDQKPARPLFTGINALFKQPTIFVSAKNELQLLLEDKFQAPEKVALTRFDFFNLGIFSYKDVAYYEMVTDDGTPLEDHDLTALLGKLLTFMTISGITQADYATMSAFSMSNT